MKKITETNMTQADTMASNIIPMFKPDFEEKQDDIMANKKEISIFDVKELYDAAYEAQEYGAKGEESFQRLIAKAVQMDMEYRQQLAKKTNFRYVSRPSAVADQAFGTQKTSNTKAA
jgi:hypothetical protein